MRKILIILLVIFWSLPVIAQVIVPSLDQALPVELASASAWRVGTTVAMNIAVNYQDEDASNDASIDNTYNKVLLAYQPGNFITELSYSSINKSESVNIPDSSVTWNDVMASDLSLRLAIRGNRSVSLGLGYNRSEFEDVSGDYISSSYEGSFSLRLMDGFLYAGGGLQRFTIDQNSGDSLKYNTLIGGAAIQIGDPLVMMFQTEASVKLTAETDSDKGVIPKKNKTTESQLNVEFITGSFFLSYKYNHTLVEKALLDEDVATIQNRFGLGGKLGDFSLGIYRNAWRKESGTDNVDYDTYLLTLGFNFL